jgi:cytochrome c-type biogenesis protein CcmH/NrfG
VATSETLQERPVAESPGAERSGGRAFEVAGRRIDPGGVVAWVIPVALILYLGLKNGGYDPIPRGDAGVLAWWVVLIGLAVAALPAIRIRSVPGILIVLLAAFGAWTALSLTWSQSDERTMIEVARVATYLGFLVLAVGLQQRGYGRELLLGVTSGVAVITVLAALSRFEPNWFPEQETGRFIPGIEIERRLAYPLNYSTGLAAMTAMGLPLFLHLMASGRTILGRSVGAAMLPIAVLVLWWTGSSLSIPLAAVGIVAYLVFSSDRLPALASLALAAVGGLVLIVASHTRDALERGLPTPDALREGDQLLVVTIIVCVVLIVARFALQPAFRRLAALEVKIPARRARQALIAGLAVIVVAIAAAGASGALSERWESFKSATGLDPNQGGQGSQLTDVSARGRFQFWEGAVDAWRSDAVLGMGPGTFEFWWAQHGDPDAAIFVVNAHSLYLENLAELGPLGFLLILAFVVVALVAGAMRAWRSTLGNRPELAAALAACFVFAAAAAVDWVWQLAVLPAAFLFAVAVAVGPEPVLARGSTRTGDDRGPTWKRFAPAILTAGLAVIALIAIAIPLASESAVERSQEQVADGDLNAALDSARDAVAIEPFAATPRLQEATTLELMGDEDAAVAAAREATTKEPTNWRPWLVLSRLEARAGNVDGALDAYTKARSLFPRGIPGPEED